MEAPRDMSIYSDIKKEYEKRRKTALDELEARRLKAYAEMPALQELERNINLSGLKYNKQILQNSDNENCMQNAINEYSGEISILLYEKNRLLAKFSYPPNFLEPAYKCSKCKDTGFLETASGSERCCCYKQMMIGLLFNQSNLKLAERENFGTFDVNLYSDIVDENMYGIKKSPRDHIFGIREKCKIFIDNFDSPNQKNLYFCGPAGIGKTFMANCIAWEILNNGYTVLYQTAPALFDTIGNYKKLLWEDNTEDSTYKNILNVELLVIDDLGTESPSPSRYAELLNILNTRYINNLTKPCKTIISTNIEADKLYEYYTERVASRITGGFSLIRFAGDDIRRMRKLDSR
jgi:DNA replication protein DnaC